jgi:RNA polymerase sigma-B factor
MTGDEASRSRVIEAHLPLVRSIARRYAGRGEPIDDLVQVGTIGLIKAVDRFDPDRGSRLEALARPSIEGEIRHYLRDRSTVLRVPRTERELAARLGATAADLTAREGRTPAAAEVAAVAGVDERRAAQASHATRAAQAVPLREDRAPAHDEADAVEARVLLARGAAVLDERERRMLHLRFVEDLSQAEIAAELGLSQAHVSRLLRAALDHLRSEIEGEQGDADAAATARHPAGRRSGRLLLRLPQSLHGELAAAAEREGVPLNTFIAGSLASAVGWRDPDGEVRPRGRRRSTLLLINAIVIAAAAVTGIALLLAAWLG